MSPDFSVPQRATRGVLRRKIRMPGFAGLYWSDNVFLPIILLWSVAQSVFNLIELGGISCDGIAFSSGWCAIVTVDRKSIPSRRCCRAPTYQSEFSSQPVFNTPFWLFSRCIPV